MESFLRLCSFCRSPKRRRSRSRSGSRKRKHRKRSRSRSRDHKRKSSRSYSSERRAREREKERQKKGLPPIRSKTLSGKRKSLWLVIRFYHFCFVPVILLMDCFFFLFFSLHSVQHNSVGGTGGQKGHSARPHKSV